MTHDQYTSFAQRYLAALQRHLADGSLAASSTEAAHLLGQEASESGMDVLDLVRTHDHAMAEIFSPREDESLGPVDRSTPSGAFLYESLTTMSERNAETSKLASCALVESEQRLKEEVERYNQLLSDSRRLEEQSRRLAHQLLQAQEEERREISRDLHDEVAQILAGINVRLAALREGGVINFKSFEQGIQQTQEMIEASVDVVHRYARKLRPAILDDLGLIPALRSMIKDLPLPPDLKIHLKTVPEAENLNMIHRTVIFRVAQEALLNVIRHSEARRVVVRLQAIKDGIRLEVNDNGKAFSVDRVLFSNNSKRLGLLGMKERVEMIGGVFAIASAKGEGTTVSADIPFAEFKEEDCE